MLYIEEATVFFTHLIIYSDIPTMSKSLQFLLLLCTFWSNFTNGGDIFKIYQPVITKSEDSCRHKIVFPSESGSTYKSLFEPYHPAVRPKWYNRKLTKFGKPTQLKLKPLFTGNYNPSGVPYIPTYPHGLTDKDAVYKITHDILQQTGYYNHDDKYDNDELHDPGIKPVFEHIEGDLKYDFRTKTHSYD